MTSLQCHCNSTCDLAHSVLNSPNGAKIASDLHTVYITFLIYITFRVKNAKALRLIYGDSLKFTVKISCGKIYCTPSQ